MGDLFSDANPFRDLLAAIRPTDVVRVRPGRRVRLNPPPMLTGGSLATDMANPGEEFGLLRTVGFRWVIFPMIIYAVPANRVEDPSLYEQDRTQWPKRSGAVIFFSCGLPGLPPRNNPEAGYLKHVRAFPMMIGEVASMPQSIRLVWPQTANQQLASGTPVVALETLGVSRLKALGYSLADLGITEQAKRILFLALGTLYVVDPNDFEYIPPTVAGAPDTPPTRSVGRRVDIEPAGSQWVAHDDQGPVVSGPDAVQVLDAVDEVTLGSSHEVWLDMGMKRRRVRRGDAQYLVGDAGMSPTEMTRSIR